jgi:hypothetical protein
VGKKKKNSIEIVRRVAGKRKLKVGKGIELSRK